ncbi:toprim domain-containing protein [Fusobacterium necrophorum]|uniref:toprim domain-containing protein n=1 Tax=Fusobacterium necrophorum TaxID=859 RepID=UPI00241E37EF
MPTSIEELMQLLKEKTLQYAMEMGVQINGSGFARCLSGTHEDRNPSMHYWEEKGIFHCFSCSFVADIFTLCNKLEQKPMNGPDFIEDNVFYLANKYGIPYEHLRKTLTPEEHKKHILLRTMKTFTEYVVSHVREDYLQQRNITKETAKKLCIGSVPNYQKLENYMLSQQCDLNVMKEIGIKQGFINENKLIFIIKDHWNRPVSFVSRNMNPNVNGPKYINGLETSIYEKRKIFFNWNNIKREFNPLDTLLIVEGYIDAVTPYQHGIRKVIALGSASFTKEHLEFLEKENRINRIAFALDNDKIGNQRTEKIVEAIKGMKLRKNYSLAINKTKFKDLDEALNSGEINSVNEVYDIVGLFDYEIQKLKENKEISESAIFDKFVTIICQTDSPKEREEQARTLSKYLNEYSYKTILEEIDFKINGKTERFRNEVIEITKKAFNNINKNPDYVEEIMDNIKEDIDNIKEKYDKKEGDIFERGMLSFEKQEQEKANESLYKINFGIPWFDDLDLMPGNSIIVSGLANTGNYFAVCNEKYPSILQIIRTE